MQGVSLLPTLNSNGKSFPRRNQVYYHYYKYPKPDYLPPHFGIRTEKYKLICFYGEKNAWSYWTFKKILMN